MRRAVVSDEGSAAAVVPAGGPEERPEDARGRRPEEEGAGRLVEHGEGLVHPLDVLGGAHGSVGVGRELRRHEAMVAGSEACEIEVQQRGTGEA
jgi:hypothetical protein